MKTIAYKDFSSVYSVIGCSFFYFMKTTLSKMSHINIRLEDVISLSKAFTYKLSAKKDYFINPIKLPYVKLTHK